MRLVYNKSEQQVFEKVAEKRYVKAGELSPAEKVIAQKLAEKGMLREVSVLNTIGYKVKHTPLLGE